MRVQGSKGAAQQRGQREYANKDKQVCVFCTYQHQRGKCPAWNQECIACGLQGHFAKSTKCRKNKTNARSGQRQVHDIQQTLQDSDDECASDDFLITEVKIDSAELIDTDWYETLSIGSTQVKFKLDTGAQTDLLPTNVFMSMHECNELQPSSIKLKSYSGHVIKPDGQATLRVKDRCGKLHDINFQIVERGVPILGKSSCVSLGLIKRVTEEQSPEVKTESQSESTQRCPARQVSTYGVSAIENSNKPSKRCLDIIEKAEKNGCFDKSQLGDMKNHLYDIKVKANAEPTKNPPRTVPHKIRGEVKKELDRMEELKVHCKVTEPTEWVSSMHVEHKPGKTRICLDPKELNESIKREHYPMRTIEEVTAQMPNAAVFSIIDATSGYWQIKLSEESSYLTTYNTPFGRYRYLRMPFGISSASEIWQRAMEEEFGDIEGVEIIADDVVVWGRDHSEHDDRLDKLMTRVNEVGLKLNRKKCQFSTDRVSFVGHTLTSKVLEPSSERIEAILKMPSPSNKDELATFLGMMTYLGKYIPNLSAITAPLRQLMEKDVAWTWEQHHEQAVERLKSIVAKATALRYYDAKLQVTLATDASKLGLGAVIMQEEQPIAFASRCLSPAEKNYATIEREMSGILYGCTRFHDYIYGQTVIVETDHKPLVGIFTKPLHKLSPRLQRMRMKMLWYDVKVIWKPGKDMFVPDALSRAPVCGAVKEIELNDKAEVYSVVSQLPITREKLIEFRTATANDPTLQQLISVVMDGWPSERSKVSETIKPYFPFKDEIVYCDGLLFRGNQIIVPKCLQSEMLSRIHESHQGIVKTKRRARGVLFWPGMNSQIEDAISKCAVCAEFRKAQPAEPLISHDIPNRPWSKIAADFFHHNGHDYLIIVDYYSKFPEVIKVPSTKSQTVIYAMQSVFSRTGIPDELITDNGPPFNGAEFAQFAKK